MRRVIWLLVVVGLVATPGSVWAGAVEDAKAAARARRNKDYQAAIRLNNRAINSGELSRRNLGIVYLNRGNVYDDLKQYHKAIADYNQTLRLVPTYAKGYTNRCNTYRKMKLYRRALADCTRAIQINPNYTIVYLIRSIIYKKLGELQKAKNDHAKYKQLRGR